MLCAHQVPAAPARKLKKPAGMSQAAQPLQAYMTAPLLLAPAHSSLHPVAFSFPFTRLYYGFLVVNLLNVGFR